MKRLQKMARVCSVLFCLVAMYALIAGCQVAIGNSQTPAKEKAVVEKAPEAKKVEAPAAAPAAKPADVKAPEVKKDETAAKKLGPYSLNEEGFILNWLIVGPFPNPGERPDCKGFDTDYLKNYGGEEKYVPANGMEIAKDDGKKVKWTPYTSPDTEIDFFAVTSLGLADQQENVVTYSACWLECEKDMAVEIRAGSDDGYKLWVDNKLIGTQHVYRSDERDSESYPIKLAKGTHLVLIKVDTDWGQYSMMVRVVSPDGNKAAGIKVLN